MTARAGARVALVAMLLAGACRSEPDTPTQPGPDDYRLTITVTGADGAVDRASIACLGDVQGDGFLSGNPAHNACITAMTSPGAVAVLQAAGRGDEPPCDDLIEVRGDAPLARETGTVNIAGRYEGDRIDLGIDLASPEPCERAVAWALEPLLTPMSEPRIARTDDLDG